MAQYQGRVSRLFTARYGGSFGLEGQQGIYFNTKQALPADLSEGATVEFTGFMGRNGKSFQVDDASLKVVPAQKQQQNGGGQDRQPESTVQESIRYQSARKDALVMVGILLQQNALWPADKRPVQTKVAGIIEDAVDRFTAVYFEDTGTLGALERSPPPELPQAQAPEAKQLAE